MTRAEPGSQGFGVTNGSPVWSTRKASPLRCWSCMVDLHDDLPTLAGGHDAVERFPCVLQVEHRVDGRTYGPVCGEFGQLDQLLPVVLDHEVGRAHTLGDLRWRFLGDRHQPATGTQHVGGPRERL